MQKRQTEKGANFQRSIPWWILLSTLYLLASEVRLIADDSALCCQAPCWTYNGLWRGGGAERENYNMFSTPNLIRVCHIYQRGKGLPNWHWFCASTRWLFTPFFIMHEIIVRKKSLNKTETEGSQRHWLRVLFCFFVCLFVLFCFNRNCKDINETHSGLPIFHLWKGYFHPLPDFLGGIFTPSSSA